MGKKKAKKGKVTSGGTLEKPRVDGVVAPGREDEEKIDYGGLPARDLKKNLGCG